MERAVVCGQAASGAAERGAAGRHRERVRVHADDRGQQERPQGRSAKAAGRKGRRGEAGRGSDREGGGEERGQGCARGAAAGARNPSRPNPRKRRPRPSPTRSPRRWPRTKPRKPEPKKAEAKPPTPQKKPAPPAPKFDPKKVEALLDKRDSTRLAAAGDTLNNATSLGASSGASAQISLSELDALRQRLAQLWTPPAGAKNPQELVVVFQDQASPRWPAGPRAVAATGGERQHPARDRRPRKRRTCAQPRPTFRHAQARTL